MGASYSTDNQKRIQALKEYNQTAPVLVNGIEYLEIYDPGENAQSDVENECRQRLLFVYCFAPVVLNNQAVFSVDCIRIEGGSRLTGLQALWAIPASQLTAGNGDTPQDVALDYLEALDLSPTQTEQLLVVYLNGYGDYSKYVFRLVTPSQGPMLPEKLDPVLSSLTFSFKIESASEFDPGAQTPVTVQIPSAPRIDYLARDFNSIRRLLLDRLSTTLPAWSERNAADLGIVITELLAHTGDHLSYFQDAVATEAYLGTARKRVSVRRHARLLDYAMHDGCNARAWVHLNVTDVQGTDGKSLIRKGTQFLTLTPDAAVAIQAVEADTALSYGGEVFEAMHDAILYAGNTTIAFYTWFDSDVVLPRGCTQATLVRSAGLTLQVGDLLLIEEAIGAETGLEADSDPTRKQVVRLTSVQVTTDPLLPNQELLSIAWADADALSFDFCLKQIPTTSGLRPISVARGNIVLVDHGRTLEPEELETVPETGLYRPRLGYGPLTQQGQVKTQAGFLQPFDPQAAASSAMQWTLANSIPVIHLSISPTTDAMTESWTPVRDLLASNGLSTVFIAETEDDDTTRLRFGDNIFGKAPESGATPLATYRVGNGATGNVGANALSHVLIPSNAQALGVDTSAFNCIAAVRNVLPAQGGTAPESLEDVKLYAPHAFKSQRRAVTAEDYAALAGQFPGVQKAVATLRWTGSWMTAFVAVDRLGGQAVDASFREGLSAWLEPYRLMGHDLRIEAAHPVPLEIGLTVYVKHGYLRSNVRQTLQERFSNQSLSSGERGFFHPDKFTFGQPVYLSQVIALAMSVPGVERVDAEPFNGKPNAFRRLGDLSTTAYTRGYIQVGRLEIARLDNDPNHPENGRFSLTLLGGV